MLVGLIMNLLNVIYPEKKLLMYITINLSAFSSDASRLRRLDKVTSEPKRSIPAVAQKPE